MFYHVPSCSMMIVQYRSCSISGWWFGTWLVFFIGNVMIPTDELTFFRGVGFNHQPVINSLPEGKSHSLPWIFPCDMWCSCIFPFFALNQSIEVTHCTMVFGSVQLVDIIPIPMVFDGDVSIVAVVYEPTYNVLGPHIMTSQMLHVWICMQYLPKFGSFMG